MTDINDIDKRVSVLEIEYKNTREAFERLEKNVETHGDMTRQIKERLDKQNGLIPHMAESVKNLVQVQEDMMKKLNLNDIEDAKEGAKMKILWGVGGVIGAAVLGFVLKSLLG